MLLADAERFWKVPNVYDAVGVLGLVLALASIWLSWWLAKRDIQKRLAEAAEQASAAARREVRRVAEAVLRTGLADAIRSLELAREACRGRRWPRSGELCELAVDQLTWALAQPIAAEVVRDELQGVSADLRDCVALLRRQPKSGTGDAPDEVLSGLSGAIIALHRVDGRMTGIRPEAAHGQQDA